MDVFANENILLLTVLTILSTILIHFLYKKLFGGEKKQTIQLEVEKDEGNSICVHYDFKNDMIYYCI